MLIMGTSFPGGGGGGGGESGGHCNVHFSGRFFPTCLKNMYGIAHIAFQEATGRTELHEFQSFTKQC